ncbi:MAG: hypothetical protein V2I67_09330 [Thermoanaerobaculales bacterium]|nr:hypothetical protein [Thermoanaerobaculales bacterium]
MTQHASLSPERWAGFSRDRQLLMIANEMNRATRLTTSDDRNSRTLAYERVLRLIDLTVQVNHHRPLRRELLRWRDLVAALYLDRESNERAHREALRCLLQMSPAGAAQIPYILDLS